MALLIDACLNKNKYLAIVSNLKLQITSFYHKPNNLLFRLEGSIAERSKSSDLNSGWEDPGSNPGGGRNISAFFRDGELSKLPYFIFFCRSAT